MLLIKKITLKNFKSFSKRVEIPLFPGFTVITGPNGSGKSNIIDSILFCLGLSTSTKQLRAERLSDLVSDGKKDSEVSITLGDDGKNYEITRRIRVTEKGYYSYYYLNDKPVSFYEIQNLLSQLGIHSEACNIVMQGDVTRIVEISPVQRRKILEDVAGISEFDEKKEKALEELEKVRENIEKIEAVIAEVETLLKSLEKDRNDALRYKELLAKKTECEMQIRVHEFISLKNSKERIEREIERIEKEKDELLRKLSEITERIIQINEELKVIADSISKFGDEKLGQVQTEILKITSELQAIKKSEKIYEEEIKRLEESILRKRSEEIRIRDEIEKIEKVLEEEVVKKASVEEIVQELLSKINSLKIEIENADKKYQDLKVCLLAERERLDELKEEKRKLISERDRLIEIIRRIEMEIEDANKEVERLKLEMDRDEKRRQSLCRELFEKEEELKKINSEFLVLDKNLFLLISKLSDVEEELKRCEVELTKVKTKISTLQSYSKSVETILNAKDKELSGIFGTVAQLSEVEEEYINAIEAAIGGALQFIVVESEDDAVEAIKYLKKMQAGRASFIPLRKIKDFNLDLDLSILKEKGVIDFAVNLIKCEKRFLPVFRFLLKDTVIVDTIENARMLMERNLRIVTLDGDLIEKSGLMVGGSRERRGLLISRELFDKERELTGKIRELQVEKETSISKLNEVEDKRKNLKNKMEMLNARIGEVKNEIKIIEDRIKRFNSQIDEMLEKIRVREEEKSKWVGRLNEIDKEIQKVDEEVKKVEGRIKEVEGLLKESKIPQLISEIERAREDFLRIREVLLTIDKKIGNLEFQKKQMKDSLKWIEEEILQLLERKNEVSMKMEEGKRKIKELIEKLEELKNLEKVIGEKVRELREKRDLKLNELRRLEDERGKIEFELKRFDDKLSSLEEKLYAIEENLKRYEDLMVPENLRDLESLREELEKLQNELSEFGDVNLKAIQDYENVKMRRDELVQKKDILEKERREIIERIERYEKRKREVFLEVFDAVNRNFNQILQELAEGEGELVLDGEDVFNSGLQLKVRLKNKPMQRIEALSGGEKSLVALSFILAIQMYKPAPFYAFDEIDMFLDSVNVERVAKMIKKRSKDAQFLVVSLRKPMIENADTIIGVSMGG
ncbi:MAG: chromosome segregation protein SMC, partial [Archaeoglobaceae archaeon]